MSRFGDFVRRTMIKMAVRGVIGKDQTDSGSWNTIFGTDVIKKSSDIFATYSKSELEMISKNFDVLFACFWKIALAFTEGELFAERKRVDGTYEAVNHPMVDLLENPNPYMSYDAMCMVIVCHLGSTGESWLWEIRSRSGKIVELYPIPSSWITERYIKRDGERVLSHYEVKAANGRDAFKVEPENMTRSYVPDPTNPMKALPIINAALKRYQMDEEGTSYLAEMLINMKLPGPVMKRKHAWNPQDQDAVNAMFAEKFGKGKRGEVMFLSGDSSDLSYLFPLKDLDWHGFANLNETRICSVVGVPPITIHLRSGLEKATYANFDAANRAFYRQTMRAWWKVIPSGWTRDLIKNEPGNDKNVRLSINTDGVMELQEDKNEQSKRVTNELNRGMITRRVAKEELGYETDENDDVYVIPMTLVEIPADGGFAQTPDDGDEAGKTHMHGWNDDENGNTDTGHGE